MDFSLTPLQISLQDLARTFSQKELSPFAEDWDARCHFPVETLKKAAELGFGAVYGDPSRGGTGLGRLDSVLVFEELAAGCVSTTAYLTIHNMTLWMLDTFGSEILKDQYYPAMISMDQMGSYCLTEPEAGSDAASLKTEAKLQEGHYTLNGTKCFISGGGATDLYFVMARTGELGPKGISCFLVPKATPGLSFGPPEHKMGWRNQPTTTVTFDNCKIPESHLVGQLGEGFTIAMRALNGGRLNIAACSLGGAKSALEKTLTYIQDRKQFGHPLSHFQALQFKISEMATELEAARLMTYRGAHALDQKDPKAPMYCAMAKKFATDICFKIVNEALQLHGGYGYIREYGMERLVRDLRVHQILEGTNEIMNIIIAKSLLKT